MLNFSKKNSMDRGFIYRVGLECFGRSFEFGLSYDEIRHIQRRAQSVLDEIRERKGRIETVWREVRGASAPKPKTVKKKTSKARKKAG